RYGSDGDGSFRIRGAGLQEGNCQSGENEGTTSMEDCREKDYVWHIGGCSAAPGFGSAPCPSRRSGARYRQGNHVEGDRDGMDLEQPALLPEVRCERRRHCAELGRGNTEPNVNDAARVVPDVIQSRR